MTEEQVQEYIKEAEVEAAKKAAQQMEEDEKLIQQKADEIYNTKLAADREKFDKTMYKRAILDLKSAYGFNTVYSADWKTQNLMGLEDGIYQVQVEKNKLPSPNSLEKIKTTMLEKSLSKREVIHHQLSQHHRVIGEDNIQNRSEYNIQMGLGEEKTTWVENGLTQK